MKLIQTMQKQRKSRKEDKSDRRTILLLIGLVIVFVLYRMFFKQETIGSDYRYFFFIFLIPTFLGITILGLVRIRLLRNKWKETKWGVQRILLFIFYLVQGFIFSYLSFGLLSTATWGYFNNRKASQSNLETMNCNIIKINSGTSRTSPNISFVFNGREERINIDHQTYGQYFESNPKTLGLQLTIREGIWNYYIIDKWEIKTTANTRYSQQAGEVMSGNLQRRSSRCTG